MKITSFNYKTFEGKIIRYPSVGEYYFVNIHKVTLVKYDDGEKVKLSGSTLVITNLGDIFSEYMFEYLDFNETNFIFYTKSDIEALLETQITKIGNKFLK